MKTLKSLLALVLLLGVSPAVWAQADPVKEVRAIAAKRAQAFAKGDVDAWVADVADSVVYLPARSGFRIEGKAGLRTWASALFQNYPIRQNQARQVIYQVFQNGTTVIANSYVDQTFFDRSGYMSPLMFRTTSVWMKIDGRWLLVQQHNSRIPATQ